MHHGGDWKGVAQQVAARLGGRWTANAGAGRVVVLCYHSVHPEKPFATPPELFEKHLEWVQRNCEVIRFDQAWQAAQEPGTRPRVAITFDDGYADNYQYVYPALARHCLPATFFVTVGLMEQDREVVEWFARMRGTGYEAIRPLDWRQVREMRRAGMSIGVHTYSHPNLALLGPREAYRELAVAREIVEQRLGEPARLLAYPYGVVNKHVTGQTIELAAEAGFEHAGMMWFRQVEKTDSRLAIPRFDIASDGVEVLWQKVRGWWDYLGWWQQSRPSWKSRRWKCD